MAPIPLISRARLSAGALAAGVALALLPASAGAATTFGADLSNTPTVSSSTNSVTNVIGPGGVPDTGAPVSGVLVSVRIRTRGPAGSDQVRVLTETSHPTASTYGFLNSGPEISIPFTADATATGHITEVLTRRPISAGQRLANFVNDVTTTVLDAYVDVTSECAYVPAPGAAAHMPGTTATYTTGPPGCNMNRQLISGTIEADADGDGFGDESQDQCPTNAATQGACPNTAPVVNPTSTPTPKKKCKKKRHKHSAAAAKKCKRKRK